MEAATLTGRSMIFAGGVGHATPDAMTAEQALRQAGLDFTVEMRDMHTTKRDGSTERVEGRKLIVRTDTEAQFDVVGSRYHPIQNDEMFNWCDRLVDDYGAKYEAAWALKGGREVGLTMKFPNGIQIGGVDPIDSYLLLRGRHDGKGSVIAEVTKVRLYCTNMLNVASRGAERRVRIPHLSTATQNLEAARQTFELTLGYDAAFQAQMEALIEQQITDDAFKAMTEQLLPVRTISPKHADAIVQLRHDSPTIQDELRMTRYGAFQAVTEWTDWVRPSNGSNTAAQSRVRDLLDGRVVKLKNDFAQALAA